MYMSVQQAATKWGISERRVRTLCLQGKIDGAFREGRGWKISLDATKPADGRIKKLRVYYHSLMKKLSS